MKGNEQVIAHLNTLLAGELSAIDQYFIHSRMYENWGFSKLYERIAHEVQDETNHADALIKRILFLEGTPDLSKRDPLHVGSTAEEFLHAVGLAEILGSFAPNAAFFLGYRRYGLAGALVCVAAFLLSSITIVIFLSFLYSRYHAIPALQGVLVGLEPVVIALILAAAWSMARKALTNWPAVMFAVAGAVAGAFKVNAICIAYERLKSSSQAQDFLAAVAPTVVGLVASAALLLWRSAIPSWPELLLMTVALVLLVRFKWHPAFVLAGGAALAALGVIPSTV